MALYAYLLPLVLAIVKADVELAMYQDNDFQGTYLTMTLYNTCTDLLPEFNDLANSVTTDGCAMVCRNYGCRGDCMKVEPNFPGSNNLGSIGWGNAISSVKDCRAPQQSTEVSLYWDSNYKGAKYDYTLVGDECKNVDPGFNDQASSVDTHGGCAILYQDSNCQGKEVEMKPGVPGWDFLGNVGFNDALSSMRNCNGGAQKSNEVSLYWDSNFKGVKSDYTMLGDECENVDPSFNDQASSVNTHGGCVMLYADSNCQGKAVEMKPGVAGWDFLGNVGFNDVLSSLRNC